MNTNKNNPIIPATSCSRHLPAAVGAGPILRTSPRPSSLSRSDGSARCKRETPGRPRQLLFCRSDTSYTCGNAHQARELLLCFWKQRTQHIVIVRFSDAQPAHLTSAGRGALVIIDESDAIDLARLSGHSALP